MRRKTTGNWCCCCWLNWLELPSCCKSVSSNCVISLVSWRHCVSLWRKSTLEARLLNALIWFTDKDLVRSRNFVARSISFQAGQSFWFFLAQTHRWMKVTRTLYEAGIDIFFTVPFGNGADGLFAGERFVGDFEFWNPQNHSLTVYSCIGSDPKLYNVGVYWCLPNVKKSTWNSTGLRKWKCAEVKKLKHNYMSWSFAPRDCHKTCKGYVWTGSSIVLLLWRTRFIFTFGMLSFDGCFFQP